MTERIINPSKIPTNPYAYGTTVPPHPLIPDPPQDLNSSKEFVKATRHNRGKLKWSLPDYQSLEPLIRVMMFGENEYGRDNWKKGFVKEELLDSLMRHTLALQRGEEIDPDTNESHVGGVLFNAMCYEYCRINNKFV